MLATPEPPRSDADSTTCTGPRYQVVPHDALLQEIEETGTIWSIWIDCVLVFSTLPVLSVARNFTLVALETVNGVVYAVLEGVGVEPSIV